MMTFLEKWVLWAVILWLAFSILAELAPQPAAAETDDGCFPREVVITALNKVAGETLRLSAYVDQLGVMVELFLSDDGGTWTMVRTFPDGMSCAFLSGDSFEVVPIGDPA